MAISFAACTNATKNANSTLIVAPTNATEKFQCPMKCQADTAYTTAGKCPICKMDLEKIK